MQAEPRSEIVKSILARFPGPVVLREKESSQALTLVLGLVFIGFGVGLQNFITAVFGVGVGLYVIVGVSRSISTGGDWIKLDATGVEYRYWVRSQPRRWTWKAAKGFTVAYRGEHCFVKFENSAKAKWWGLAGGQNGAREELQNVTKLSLEDRAQLLNLWRARALLEEALVVGVQRALVDR